MDSPSKPNGRVFAHPALPEELYVAQHGRCFYCDKIMAPRPHCHSKDTRAKLDVKNTKRISEGRDPDRVGGWTQDHFRPKVLCFTLNNNCVLACNRCNGKKGTRPPTTEEYGRAILIYARAGCMFAPRQRRSGTQWNKMQPFNNYLKY